MIMVTTSLAEVTVWRSLEGEAGGRTMMPAAIGWLVSLYNGATTILAYVRSSYD